MGLPNCKVVEALTVESITVKSLLTVDVPIVKVEVAEGETWKSNAPVDEAMSK